MKTKTEKTKKASAADLTDPIKDQEKLGPDPTIIDLPDVEDIPGQEYIKPPTLESFVDDTISSADEEGPVKKKKSKNKDEAREIFKEEDEGLNDSTDSEDHNLRRAALDNTDNDGDPLNEESFDEDVSGDDLDIPGADEDDDNEAIGEEDEENNIWSLEGEREDDEISKQE
jgi:hypothetical protein